MSPNAWSKFLRLTLRCLPWVLAALPRVALAQWADSFDTINPAWVADRYAPAGFNSVSFLGDHRPQITIDQTGSSSNRPPAFSLPFYNTQGRQRPGGLSGGWSLSAEVYISSAFNTTIGQLVRTDLSAHTGTTPSDGAYAVIGFTNAGPTDPLNPNASDRSFRLQVFDGTDADPTSWFDAVVPADFAFDAWHTLEATATGTAFQYRLDGLVVFTDPIAVGDNLQTAFIQAYNFGQTDSGGLNSYSVYWDNAIAIAPESASFALAAGLSTLGLVRIRRRLARKPL